jgi:hypothetical protein
LGAAGLIGPLALARLALGHCEQGVTGAGREPLPVDHPHRSTWSVAIMSI